MQVCNARHGLIRHASVRAIVSCYPMHFAHLYAEPNERTTFALTRPAEGSKTSTIGASPHGFPVSFSAVRKNGAVQTSRRARVSRGEANPVLSVRSCWAQRAAVVLLAIQALFAVFLAKSTASGSVSSQELYHTCSIVESDFSSCSHCASHDISSKFSQQSRVHTCKDKDKNVKNIISQRLR